MHIRKARLITGALLVVLSASLLGAVAPSAIAMPSYGLEVIPEFTEGRDGGEMEVYVLTARLSQPVPVTERWPVRIDFEWDEGPLDTDPDWMPPQWEYGAYDHYCVIPQGLDSCSTSVLTDYPTSAEASQVRAWVDYDVDNRTVEADLAEGRYAGPGDCVEGDPAGACAGEAIPGSEPEPDATDVAQLGGSLGGGSGNAMPEATDDAAAVAKNGAVDIAVLANDVDPDGDPLSLEAVTAPSNGSVSVNPDQSVRYTPRRGFKGEDVFTYTVSDGRDGTDTARVVVSVGGRS